MSNGEFTPEQHEGPQNLSPEDSVPYLNSLGAAMRVRVQGMQGSGYTLPKDEAEHWKALFQVSDPRAAGELVLAMTDLLDQLINDPDIG